MHYKAGRQNHDFQIVYFLAGACHTADAAYALLKDQWEDRNNAIGLFVGAQLRVKAKLAKAKHLMEDEGTSSWERLEAEADVSDIVALQDTTARNLQAAIEERDFIEKCIQRLEPHRKYRHLSDAEAAQAAQREEWRLELTRRAENYLMNGGLIPVDHYNTMRMHPDFHSQLLPHIEKVTALLKHGGAREVLNYRDTQITFDAPKLLLPDASSEKTT